MAFGFANEVQMLVQSPVNFKGFLIDDKNRLSFVFQIRRRPDDTIPSWVEENGVLILPCYARYIDIVNAPAYFLNVTQYIKPESWYDNLELKGEMVIIKDEPIREHVFMDSDFPELGSDINLD